MNEGEAGAARYQRSYRADGSCPSVSRFRARLVQIPSPQRLGDLPDYRKRVRANHEPPGYPFPGLTVERVRTILAELIRVEGHRFWPDSVSLLENRRFDLRGVRPKQVTDLYLLGLAVANGGRLITFDQTIPCRAAADFQPQDIEVLG